MSRGLRWRIQFKSLNGTGCLINIYEEGWTSTPRTLTGADVPVDETVEEPGVTWLIPAANPFDYQEDDNEDLLHFIRFKTGYIRVIEPAYGDLADLQPNGITHHYVVAYYGSEIVFTGYMQCQEMSGQWVKSPRELEFAVISPLGLLSSFNFTPPAQAGQTTIGNLLYEVLSTLNPFVDGDPSQPGYETVVFTYVDGTPTYQSTNGFPLSGSTMTTTVCPYNDSFNDYNDDTDKVFAPVSFLTFMEDLCGTFGYTLHETPKKVYFIIFDHTGGNYYEREVTSLTSGPSLVTISGTSIGLYDYYHHYDDDAKENIQKPMKKVVVNLPSVSGNIADMLPVKRAKRVSEFHGINQVWYVRTYSRKSREVTNSNNPSPHPDYATINTTNCTINEKGLYLVEFGSRATYADSLSLNKKWVIRLDSTMTGNRVELARCTFHSGLNMNGGLLLKLRVSAGLSLNSLSSNFYPNSFKLWIRVYCGSYDTEFEATIDSSTGKIVSNITATSTFGVDNDGYKFTLSTIPFGAPFTVVIMSNNTSLNYDYLASNNVHICFEELSITTTNRDLSAEYQNEYVLDNAGNGVGEASVGMGFNVNSYGWDKCVSRLGDFFRGDIFKFQYMFSPRFFLRQRMKVEAPLTYEYARIFNYWRYGWRWRLVAHSFNMRDDAHTLTIVRSESLEE